MLNTKKNLILFLFTIAILLFVNLNAQNINIEKQYYQDSIDLAKYKQMLIEGKYDSIGLELSNIDNTDKISSMSEYNASIEDLRHEYDLQSLELESSIQNNKDRVKIIIGIIVFLMIGSLLSIILYIQNTKLQRYREKWKMMQISAEIALRNKNTLLSNMSHEIKTPLNALIGFSDLITDSDDLDEASIHEFNEIIKLNSSLLRNLINDVVDMSRLNINDLRIKLQDCDIIDVCNKTINTLQHIKQSNAEIIFESVFEHFMIKTDPLRIQQVLINLLVNATKFCKEGKITLKVEKEKDNLCISVADTGIGIPIEKQQQVFDRFEKVEDRSNGTGLGLSICKLIITELKGKIWIDSTYTEGAKFVFTLPIQ